MHASSLFGATSSMFVLFNLTLLSLVSASSLVSRQSCDVNYTPCQPSGASSSDVPTTGPGLAPLYNDLLASVKNVAQRSLYENADSALISRDSPSMCCNSGLACVNVQGLNVPMCYDHFTTNFKLANGATGTLDSGGFTGADGGTANLLKGNYTAADKSTGNMYTGDAALQSPTNTAAIPTPYTASGVGSAIPLSALGGYATFIITIPGTTLAATTVAGTTNAGETAPSTVAGTTNPGTTQAATTISAHTSLITSMIAAGTAAPSSSSAGHAGIGLKPTGVAAAGVGLAAVAMLL